MKTFFPIPPDETPEDTVCVLLRVPNNQKWLSVFWWILDQYNYWYNWQRTDDKRGIDIAQRWREMFWQAIQENDAAKLCPDQILQQIGVQIEEDISMNIRISPDDSCIIQLWCIDHWEDWYDPRLCIAEGAAQNPPAGEVAPGDCAAYDLTVRGDGRTILPVPVKPGAILTISNAQGGWWDGNVLHAWNCPSGLTYALGACVSAGATDAGSPIPALSIGRLIVKIGSTYYDAYNTSIVIPANASPADAYFQMNDASLSGNQGSVSMRVEVCQPENSALNLIADSPFTGTIENVGKHWKITSSAYAPDNVRLVKIKNANTGVNFNILNVVGSQAANYSEYSNGSGDPHVNVGIVGPLYKFTWAVTPSTGSQFTVEFDTTE